MERRKESTKNLCQYEVSDSDSTESDDTDGSTKKDDTRTESTKIDCPADRPTTTPSDHDDLPKAYRRKRESSADTIDSMDKRSKKESRNADDDESTIRSDRTKKDRRKHKRRRRHSNDQKNVDEEEPIKKSKHRRDGGSPRERKHSERRSDRDIGGGEAVDRDSKRSGHAEDREDYSRRNFYRRGNDEDRRRGRHDRGVNDEWQRRRDSNDRDDRNRSRRSRDWNEDRERPGTSRNDRSQRHRGGYRDARLSKQAAGGESSNGNNGPQISARMAEQMQKRKLLWSKEKPVAQSWETMLSACTDEKQAEKLKKMIGIRNDSSAQAPAIETNRTEEIAEGSTTTTMNPTEEAKRREEISRQLQRQYETARMSTHTHRGMGLGFM